MQITQRPTVKTAFKVLLFWIIFMGLLFVAGAVIVKQFPADWERWVYGITGTIAATISTLVLLKVDKKSLAYIGLCFESKTFTKFFTGIVIGSLLFAFIICMLLLFTEIKIKSNILPFGLVSILAYLSIFPLALMEEIAFRAYPFVQLNKVFSFRITQLIIAFSFAFYHIITGWRIEAAFAGPFIWAFIFVLAAKKFGGIAAPTGIHVAINVMQPLFGFTEGKQQSLFVVYFPEVISEQLKANTDKMGLFVQIIIFIVALVLTEYYTRKKPTTL